MRLNTQGAAFAIFLGALAALPPISIDMALPALTAIGAGLHTGAGPAGLTLSLFMVGFALSPIVYGPLSDRFGRRPLLLIGLALFIIGGIAAASAPSIELLLFARLVQGAGAGAGMTLAMAMVRDLFEGRLAQSRLAVITVVANVAPIVSPAFGAALMGPIGWRGIYGVTAICGALLTALVVFGVRESATTLDAPQEPLLRQLTRDYAEVFRHRRAIGNILVNALAFAWMFAYVAGSPLVLIETLHVTPGVYAAMFACTGTGIVAGASLNGRLVHGGVSPQRLLLAAVVLAVVATVALVALTLSEALSLWTLMPLLVLSTACFGMVAPSAAHGTLDPMPKLAGSASGLLTSVQMLFGAAASSVVALTFPLIGPLAMTGTMAGLALIALPIALAVTRVRVRSGPVPDIQIV